MQEIEEIEDKAKPNIDEKQFCFEPIRNGNVHIQTKDNGNIFVHSLILEIRSQVFRDIDYSLDKKTIIPFDFSYEASIAFFTLMYAIDIHKVELKHKYLLEIWKITFQYDVKEYFKMITNLLIRIMTRFDNDDLCWIYVGNLACKFKELHLMDNIFEKYIACTNFLVDDTIMLKLNPEFKDYLLSKLLKLQPSIQRRELFEVKDDDADWYVGEVVKKDGSMWKFQLQGFKDKYIVAYAPPNINRIAVMGTRKIKNQINTEFGVLTTLE
jgi:hypothetical protein